MSKFKIILISIGVLVILIGVGFTNRYIKLEFEKFFAPKEQNVKREVFEQTQSYVKGKRQELSKLYMEYMMADSADKIIVKRMTIKTFSDVDKDEVFDSEHWNQYNEIIK